LFGFIGLPHLTRRSNPRELREQISHQLVRCFGDKAGMHTEIHIEDWALNSNICANLDLTSPPNHPEIVSDSLRTSNCAGRIYFSVAEIASQSPGLIEGAFSAAENTAHDVIADLHNK
jgi:monoamine oxidase